MGRNNGTRGRIFFVDAQGKRDINWGECVMKGTKSTRRTYL